MREKKKVGGQEEMGVV